MKALNDLADDHDLLIINDSAQAHGTEVDGRDIGSYEPINCYSFYPTKSMTTGEGGIVITNDPELHRLGCLIRSHGDAARYHHVMLGLNYRMTDIAAAIGLNQLEDLDEHLRERRRNGKTLREALSKIDSLHPQKITEGVNPSYSYFSLVMDPDRYRCTRDEVMEALEAENISCAVHYPTPLTKQPAITSLMKPQKTPVSEAISERIFSLPMHPELTEEDLKNIVKGVEKVASHHHV